MKKAAEDLDVNYSTAKTIIQIFRKEKRIARKPKHLIVTKKSLRREKFLKKMTNPYRIKKVMAKVIKAELKKSKKKKSSINKDLFQISEAKTLAVTNQMEENVRRFPRIESAGQMVIFADMVFGPKAGQMTKGTLTNIQPIEPKTKLFHINISEECYRGKINYNDLLLLKNICKQQVDPSLNSYGIDIDVSESKKGFKSEVKTNKLPVLPVDFPVSSYMKRGNRVEEKSEIFFDFTQYAAMIVAGAHKNRRIEEKEKDWKLIAKF